MPRILVTAYGPYDEWEQNVSWIVLQELTRSLPPECPVTTRLYPVDFSAVKTRLAEDLRDEYDFAIHLGQAPGRATISLEAIGLNLARERGQRADEAVPLMADGPPAYFSRLPLGDWAATLRDAGIPAEVSHHAGTYLCNAALFLSHYFAERARREISATFLHLPLDTAQVIASGRDLPSLSAAVSATAVRVLIEKLLNDQR
jgi:pyroglutamyl-peptidase